jgi:hypothetical protein
MKLKTPNATRWNSQFDSLSCLLKIVDDKGLSTFNRIITNSTLNCKKFVNDEIVFIREWLRVMEPIATGLDNIQAEDEAYQGIFLPTIDYIETSLKETYDDTDIVFCRPLIDALLEGMEARFAEAKINMEYQLASAFHPECKMSWLRKEDTDEENIGKIETLLARMKSEVLRELKKNSKNEQEQLEQSLTQKTPGSQQQTESDFSTSSVKPKSKARTWLSQITARKVTTNPGEEMLKKRAATIVDAWLEQNWSLLDGQGTSEERFPDAAFMHEPTLMRLFIRFNTGIPSSAGVERMFSIGKLIFRDNRARLSDKNFNALMFLKGNINL